MGENQIASNALISRGSSRSAINPLKAYTVCTKNNRGRCVRHCRRGSPINRLSCLLAGRRWLKYPVAEALADLKTRLPASVPTDVS